jgi:hypothetical protein
MPQIPELANAVLFFAPGLLLVQTLYLGGIGRRGWDFERVVWSIIASALIRWAAAQLVGQFDFEIEQGLELEISLLGLALAVGVIAGLAKRAFLFVFGEEEEQA